MMAAELGDEDALLAAAIAASMEDHNAHVAGSGVNAVKRLAGPRGK